MLAILYDGLLLVGVLFIATLLLLPFTGGEAIARGNFAYRAYLLGVTFLFYGWFWTHGGQTLGMRAWKIRVQTYSGGPLSWGQALLRFAAAGLSWAALGFGFWWALLDAERQTWHDRLSKTMLVRATN